MFEVLAITSLNPQIPFFQNYNETCEIM